MSVERVEKLRKIALRAGIDSKILPSDGVSDIFSALIAKRADFDKKLKDLDELVSRGGVSGNAIRDEIDWLAGLMGYALEIDHLPAAHKAIETCNLLTESQRIKLSPVIEHIGKYRDKIRQQAEKSGASGICAECGGKCCGRDIEKMISEMDFFYMFSRLRDEQINGIWKVLQKPDALGGKCRFQSEDGCTIPVKGRPGSCQAYYCEDIPIIGEPKKTDSYAKKLSKKLKALQRRLGGMGFDLEVNDQ